LSRMFSDIQRVMKFSVSENYLHRQPLLGGWQSNDYTLSGEILIDPHLGLPAIAIVEDPLAGEVVQVSGDLFKPISALRAYGVLTINILVQLVGLLALLCFP